MANDIKRDYQNDYPSVTTILGVLRKIGLEMWFKYNTASFCDEKSKKGKEIGTQIHAGIEEIINTGTAKIETTYTEEVTNAIKGFIQFRKDHPEFTFKNSELKMTSDELKVNGTLDCVAEKDGVLLIADWKTGECKKNDKPEIYDEYLFQVAAYVFLYNETAKANVQSAFILSLAKDKIAYNFQVLTKEEIDAHFYNAFVPALQIYNHQQWLKGQKKEKKYV